jgi:hypothetical protein
MYSNTSGKPDTKYYTIPKGELYFSELSALDVPLGFVHAGNVPELSMTTDVETLEHASSMYGIKEKDLELTTARDLNITFKLEEFTLDNLKKFFAGSSATVTNPAVAGFTTTTFVPVDTIQLATWYDIVDSNGVRAMDLTAANVTIATSNAIPVTLVKDTDYELDTVLGRIFTIPGSAKLATAISAKEGLTVAITATAAAKAILQLDIYTQDQVTVAVKWVSKNANSRTNAQAKITEYYFPKVTLTSDQAINLVSQEITSFGMKGSCVKSKVTSSPLVIRSLAD